MYISVEEYINDPAGPYWRMLTVHDAQRRTNIVGDLSRALPFTDSGKAYRAAVRILKEATHSKWQERWRVKAVASWFHEHDAACYINACERNRLARLNSPHYQSKP